MVLDLPPGSPPWACAAAALVLSLHITAGSVGLVSGYTALFSRKGSYLHRRAGNWFFVSMLVMSGIGACGASIFPQKISVVAGVLTFYLVATGWSTVMRRAGSTGLFELAAFVVACTTAAAGVVFGWQAINSPTGLLEGLPGQPSFVFAGVAMLGAVGDLKMILRGGISGAQRVSRHLWRMCVALLIAATSFFLGQQQVLPAFFERDANGLPTRWVEMMRHSIAELGTEFSTNRMVREYVERLYLPAHRDLAAALTAV